MRTIITRSAAVTSVRHVLFCLFSLVASGIAAEPTAPPVLPPASTALAMVGEESSCGRVDVDVIPAPDAGPDEWTLRMVFHLEKHRNKEWIDASTIPAPPLDLSRSAVWRLWIRAEQPASFLHIKIVDPDNPPPNHSAVETALTDHGRPLPAGKWVPIDLRFPADVRRRDNVVYFGFYIAAADQRIPLNRDLVFYAGRFRYRPPQRSAWPPEVRTGTERWETVWAGPLTRSGPWILVRGKDNQNDHPARFVRGGVEFDSTADGWNEFLWSDPERLRLLPGVEYRLRFDYRILRAPSGPAPTDPGYFYSLVRARGTIKEDVGWQKWTGHDGEAGVRSCRFVPHDKEGYYLIFGVRHRGAVRIENLRIERSRAGRGPAR